ncbi:Protein CBG24684 [Caenorhabditis briggsae]|uniref:Protein CBG24684 n=1 Tax=Caenorhabditis briggsae TaxID=6238 RepID=A8WL90_CAEBR|nr:Protein CBG24684 [Caenorhabditis briggsae]CAP21235.2 Protein CBG24684 [Caenorhabditis briggsae]
MADVAVGLPILSRRSRSAKITAVAPKSGKSTKSAKSTNIPRVQKSKVPKHPTYSVMVYTAIKDLHDRNGASNFMINRYIASRYFCDGKAARTRTLAALKKGLADGSLILVTGVGARGMFKVSRCFKNCSKESVQIHLEIFQIFQTCFKIRQKIHQKHQICYPVNFLKIGQKVNQSQEQEDSNQENCQTEEGLNELKILLSLLIKHNKLVKHTHFLKNFMKLKCFCWFLWKDNTVKTVIEGPFHF